MKPDDVADIRSALRDIAYALQALSAAMSPHGQEREVNRLLVSAHEAIERMTPNVEVTGAARPYCAASVLTAGLCPGDDNGE